MNVSKTKCGFVAVIGLPNAGKSTFMNTLIGAKVSIVSKKVQTTRMRVLGILTHQDTQIIMVDTPGIFAPQKTFEKAMVKVAWDALGHADVIAHIVDASTKDPLKYNQDIIRKLPRDRPCILILNKVDLIHKPDLLLLSQKLNDVFDYATTFMVSSLKNKGLKEVLEDLANRLPPGPWAFEEDQMTDMPLRLMAAEITREKVFQQLHEELPYSVFVETEQWEEFDNGSIKISQLIYTQRESQKSIILGKGGARIKQIGEQSRQDLEKLLECRVHLKLFVKVKENWPQNADFYRLIGLDF